MTMKSENLLLDLTTLTKKHSTKWLICYVHEKMKTTQNYLKEWGKSIREFYQILTK